MHKRLAAALFIIAAGILLTLYPWISNILYQHHTESQAGGYEARVEKLTEDDRKQFLEAACAYNRQLTGDRVCLTDPFDSELPREEAEAADRTYRNLLSFDEDGLMAFVEIPAIDQYLPVYHGTSSEILEKGVGHLEGTSLPVGGGSTHAVLSAHTGINSAKLFTDLTEMQEGDLFFIHVCGETLAYRTISIQVVLPDDTGPLQIQTGRDLVTLLTCTPYGVNSHRLLVTGERYPMTSEAAEEAAEKASEETAGGTNRKTTQWMKAYREALVLGFAAALLLALGKAGFCRLRSGKGRL